MPVTDANKEIVFSSCPLREASADPPAGDGCTEHPTSRTSSSSAVLCAALVGAVGPSSFLGLQCACKTGVLLEVLIK